MDHAKNVFSPASQQRRDRVLEQVGGTPRSQRDHDLRNLLYIVGSFSQLLSDGLAGAVTPRQKELLADVLECTRQMRQLLSGPDAAATVGLPTPGLRQPAAANS